MPVAKPESSDSRVIAHIDMDCFYVQVEQRKQPELRGLPTAVVQYNSWKGGGLIAVSYEARKFGVKRSMRGDEAKQVCPQIHLVQVPVARGKADLNLYRNAGSEVVSILARKCLCERASIDEVYLDLSDAAERMLAENPPENLESIDEEALKSHILGLNEDGTDAKENVRKWLSQRDADHRNKLLACAAVIVAELRMQVLKETAFTCSAGVAHNKMLAKLASGMNKPAQQTIVPFSSVGSLLGPLPIKKMKQLGGKLGDSLQTDLGVSTVGNLLQFSEEKLQERYGINTGTWLWNIARGISGEEVQERLLPNSHGSGKTFPGPQALRTIASVQCWLNELCEELNERLCSDFDQNKRIARTLTLHARAHKGSDSYSQKKFPSKSCPLRYGILKLQEDALTLFQTGLREYLDSFGVKSQGSQQNEWRITGLSVSATKIVAIPTGTCSITKYFHGQALSPPSSKQSSNRAILNIRSMSPPGNEDHLEVYIPETQMDLSDEDTTIKCVLPTRSKQVERINDQDSSSKRAMQYWCQNEPSPLSTSESVSSLKWNLPEPKGDLLGEGTDIKYSTSNVARHKQKRNMLQDKAAPSILRFVHRFDSLQQEPERAGVVHEDRAFDPSGACCSAANSSTYSGSHALEQNKQRMETWKYKVDDIDPTVVNELPPEIQEEIRVWIRPQKRSGIAKRGSSIAHYFLPNKNL